MESVITLILVTKLNVTTTNKNIKSLNNCTKMSVTDVYETKKRGSVLPGYIELGTTQCL